MAIEAARGCGFRKVGGLYLVCPKEGRRCGLLPLPLTICPACGHGVKQTRGWTWINPEKLFEGATCRLPFDDCQTCPMHDPAYMERAGLLWIGKQFYPTPEHFRLEADSMGISRRIAAIPRGFEVGKTWVFLAHPEAIPGQGENGNGEPRMIPGVFTIFKPTAIEMIVTETQARDEVEMARLRKRGITPVAVPDDDKDHQGSAYDKQEADD